MIGMYHYHTLQKLYSDIFKRPFKESHIQDIIAVDKEPYYLISDGYSKYLLYKKNSDGKDVIDDFPIIVEDYEEKIVGNKVYYVITKYRTINIKEEKTMSFKEFVNRLAPFNSTSTLDFLLYKIITLSAVIDRINVTVSTEASFGKDSVIDILKYLHPHISKTTPTSMASIIYRLENKLLAINEVSDMKGEDMTMLEMFLSTAGAFGNVYENPKRANVMFGTKDVYDISNLSLMLLYNNYEYFLARNKVKKFFDNFFKEHIRDRFLSIRLDGVLLEDFIKEGVDNYERAKGEYVEMIRNLNYWMNNPAPDIDYDFTARYNKLKLSSRQKKSYYTIAKYIYLYLDGKKENFDKMLDMLDDRIMAYKLSLRLNDFKVDEGSRVKCYDIYELKEKVGGGVWQKQY